MGDSRCMWRGVGGCLYSVKHVHVYTLYTLCISLKRLTHFHASHPFILILLQLRIEKGSHGQLIFYNRNDTAGPKLSDYTKTIVQVSHHKIYTTIGNTSIVCFFFKNPEDLKNTLSLALGVKGIKVHLPVCSVCIDFTIADCQVAVWHTTMLGSVHVQKIIIIHYRPLY